MNNRTRASAAQKGKGIAGSSSQVPESDVPWNHEGRTPFTEEGVLDPTLISERDMKRNPMFKSRKRGDSWTELESTFYNGLLRLQLGKTRFGDKEILEKMGILEEARLLIKDMGLGTVVSGDYKFYPELVLQFLASVEVHYEDPKRPIAREGKISFFCLGKKYEVSITDLCKIYGFERKIQEVSFEHHSLQLLDPVWEAIGSGPFRTNKQSLIRHPVVRTVARLASFTFFSKKEASSLRRDELMVLYGALAETRRDFFDGTPAPIERVNMGAYFAEMLAEKKFRGLGSWTARRSEVVGSLLTPIFSWCGVDLSNPNLEVDGAIDRADEHHFEISGIFKGNVYFYKGRDGRERQCVLPNKRLNNYKIRANLEFDVPSSEQCDAEGGELPGDTNTDPAPSAQMSSSGLPTYDDRYAPPPPREGATAEEYWDYEVGQRHHSMLSRLWHGIVRMTSCSSKDRAGDVAEPAGRELNNDNAEDNESSDESQGRRRRARH